MGVRGHGTVPGESADVVQKRAKRQDARVSEVEPEGRELEGSVLDGRYELVEHVESGGMGHIYRARDRRLEFRQVAVKVLREGLPDDQIARFKREALLTGGLSSPHVVKTSDFGSIEGRAYLVMEWLKGESLADLLIREKRVPLERAVRIVDGVLAGLEAAHEAGIVHRDLKPENVFVVREPGVVDYAKILDFGFARVNAAIGDSPVMDVTGEDRVVVGTVSYMAPEQLRGQSVDHRADLYSAAALLFRLISGHLPYETKGPSSGMVSQAAFRALRLDEPPRHLLETHPELDGTPGLEGVDAVLQSALTPDPNARPESAGAMRRALNAAVGGPELPFEASKPGADVGRWSEPASGLHDLANLSGAEPGSSGADARPKPPWALILGGGAAVLVALGYFLWRALR